MGNLYFFSPTNPGRSGYSGLKLINKQIESNSQYKPQLTTILNEINAEKDPNKKKEKIINFSLILKQGGAEDIIKSYTEASQPTTEGKSQGGWSQTPATPLSK